VRDGFAQTLAASLEQCIGKPAGSAQKSAAEVEVDELRAENKKLQYRVTHLLKTVAEVEAAGK